MCLQQEKLNQINTKTDLNQKQNLIHGQEALEKVRYFTPHTDMMKEPGRRQDFKIYYTMQFFGV